MQVDKYLNMKVCRPANAALTVFALTMVLFVVTNFKKMRLDLVSIAPIIVLGVLAVHNAIGIDIYCATNHPRYAWFIAALSAITFVCVALCMPAGSSPPATDEKKTQ